MPLKAQRDPGLLLEQKGPFPAGSSNKNLLAYLFGNGASSVGLLFCLPATLEERGWSQCMASAWELQFYEATVNRDPGLKPLATT